ncbi:MAG TPA: hypothetical protein VGJ18_26720 [Gemmatimonadaceae bacterium]
MNGELWSVVGTDRSSPTADHRSLPITVHRPSRLVLMLVGVATFAVGASLVDGLPVGVTNDDGMYVILAKSLATGHGYRWLNLPGTPAAIHFPPGYPAFLALLWLLYPAFPANVVLFKLANAMLTSIAAAGTFVFARKRLNMSDVAAALLTFAATLGIPMLTLSTIVMSEPLFLALLLPALLLAERLTEPIAHRPPFTDHRLPSTADVLILGLIAAAATLVRSHGIALIVAVGAVLCLRRRFRHAAIFAGVAMLLLLPWQLWVSVHSGVLLQPMRGNYESYGAWLSAGLHADGFALIPRTLARTSMDVAGMIVQVTAPSLPPALRIAALVAVLAIGAVGMRELWRSAPVTALFIAFYIGIVLVWPFPPTRFVWGIWPLVMLPPVLGARRVLQCRPSTQPLRATRMATLAAALLLAIGYGSYNLRGYRHQWWSSIARGVSRTSSPLLTWIATHTPRNVLLASEVESAVYLYTGRTVVPVTTFTTAEYFNPRTPRENADAMREIVAHYHPNAVVITSSSMREAARVLAFATPPVLAAVDTFPAGGLVLIPTPR